MSDIVSVIAGDEIYHYGILERSGRYPWGSGENPYQRLQNFAGGVAYLRKEGFSDTEIAKALNMSTTTLRSKMSLAKEEKRAADAALAVRLKEKGYSNVAIGERMGVPESSVRNMLKYSESVKKDSLRNLADTLKKEVDEKGVIDVGAGVELYLGVSRSKMTTAIDMLKDDGYKVYWVPVEQLGTGKNTNLMCVAKADENFYDIKNDTSRIKPIGAYSEDGGVTFERLAPPRSISSDRVMVRYSEDGGTDKDGLIELRRGVDDISLGGARYAQVRIAVDGERYMKGMAVYSDNMPDGVDIIYNSNKSKKDYTKLETMKKMGPDPNNPFSSAIKNDNELILAQRHYIDKDGKRQQSCLNIVNEEGNWGEWSSSLSSQFLSKQNLSLIKQQLGKALKSKQDEFAELSALNQPLVKKKLMESFAEDCDAASVHLKAAGMPRQGSHVILPFPKMKENEIYAPNYNDGESVVLIRYPHGGKFEIPELTVNNKFKEAKGLLGNAPDAVGIHPKVAERLSGADFDGDTVLVIPNNTGAIKTSPALAGLKNFDTKAAYPHYEGMHRMTPKEKQNAMGRVSNLITDMTIKGASLDELCRAVKHSMVVIDAEKHYLNYEQSYKDQGIAELQKKYQGKEGGGASTLISRSKSTVYVKERKEGVLVTDPKTGKTKRQYVDPKTGEKLYEETGGTHFKKVHSKTKGDYYKEEPNTQKSTRMAETRDARTLSSGSRVEELYADYANSLKSLANQARKQSLEAKMPAADPQAKKDYAPQVESLKAQLNTALKNAPLERQAQIVAKAAVKARQQANPAMEQDDIKKAKGQELVRARQKLGAAKTRVKISDKEWEAIQKGAVSPTTLEKILNNADMNEVKKLATPRTSLELSSSQVSRIQAMVANGKTQAEIASALGISTSTVQKYS